MCSRWVKSLVLPISDSDVSAVQKLGGVVLQNPGEPPYIITITLTNKKP